MRSAADDCQGDEQQGQQTIGSCLLPMTMATARRARAFRPDNIDFGHFENAQQSVGLQLIVLGVDVMTDGLQYHGALVLQARR